MGWMDRLKSTVDEVQTNAMDIAVSKKAEIEQNIAEKAEIKEQERAQELAVQEEQQRLKAQFSVSKKMGDVSIDIPHELFMVRRASAQLPKKSGMLMKTGKAIAAMSTLGASIAIEQAMKPDNRVFRFDEIRSFELIQDDSSVMSGGVGAAVAGGLLLGGVGAIVGSNVGKRKGRKVVENLFLKINLKSLDFPCVIIPYIDKAVKVSSNEYKKAFSAAQETVSCLELIVDAVDQAASSEQANVMNQGSNVAEQIMQFKSLLDMGAISEEEFEMKKRELLGLQA